MLWQFMRKVERTAGAGGDHQGEAAEASEASVASGHLLTGAHIDPVDYVEQFVGAQREHRFRT